MSHVVVHPLPTPNVVIENPKVRKFVGNSLAVASVGLAIATLVDGAIAEIEFSNITGPAAVIIAGLFGIFQLGVTSPNVPKRSQPYGEGEGLFE